MNIISIDGSTKSTGIAYFTDKKLVAYDCFTASSSDLINRIYKMSDNLKNFIKEHPTDKIILEEVIPKDSKEEMTNLKNLKTRKALMYLQAQFNFMLHDNFPKIEIEYVYPSEWRAGCGISTGRGIKRDSLKVKDIEFVKKTYGLSLNDDISDAICIGYFATHKRNDEEINWG